MGWPLTRRQWVGGDCAGLRFTSPVRSALTAGALCGSLEEQITLAHIAREPCRSLEFCASLAEAAELLKEVATYAGQQVVGLE